MQSQEDNIDKKSTKAYALHEAISAIIRLFVRYSIIYVECPK